MTAVALSALTSIDSIRVAVVDDVSTSRRNLVKLLQQAGCQVSEITTWSALEDLNEEGPQVVCVDEDAFQGRGREILRSLHEEDPGLPVIVVAARQSVESAVLAMRDNALDYLTKPLDASRLLQAVARGVELCAFAKRLRPAPLSSAQWCEGWVRGRSPARAAILQELARLEKTEAPALFWGEAGVGKRCLALRLHAHRGNRKGPFLVFDAAQYEESRHEPALWGGSDRQGAAPTRGWIEQSWNGSLYIENIERLSWEAQEGLALLLADQKGKRGKSGVRLPVRILASSTEELRGRVARGAFHEGLLAAFGGAVRVPALRERQEDLAELAGFLVETWSQGSVSAPVSSHFDEEALAAITGFEWPGNLIELERMIAPGWMKAAQRKITWEDLPRELRAVSSRTLDQGRVPASTKRVRQVQLGFPENEVIPLRELERLAIEHALRVTRGSVTLAAQRLGIGRATLYRRIASLAISGWVA